LLFSASTALLLFSFVSNLSLGLPYTHVCYFCFLSFPVLDYFVSYLNFRIYFYGHSCSLISLSPFPSVFPTSSTSFPVTLRRRCWTLRTWSFSRGWIWWVLFSGRWRHVVR
jgi:hypothetical protein